MTNTEVRAAAKSAGVTQWRIAEAMQIGETTLCRRMRTELPETEKRKILKIIEKLSKEVG